jgi:multiple sugar transport system permease protein
MIALLFASPLIAVWLSSLKLPAEASKVPPTYLPSAISLQNFRRINIGGVGALHYVQNSAVVAVGTVACTLVLATLAGYGFSQYRFRGSGVVFVIMLAAIMFPFQTVLTPLYIELRALSLTDSLIGLILVLSTFQLPFAVFVMRNSFDAVPRPLFEAAAVDGAGLWRSLLLVLPLVRPGLITAGLFAFFAAWNEFFAPLILLADQAKFTLPIMLTTVTNGAYGSIDWGILQAGVVITILPCTVIFVVLQRHYVRGLVAGSDR